jgi:hypothetical protein
MNGLDGDMNRRSLKVGKQSIVADSNSKLTIRYDTIILDIVENTFEIEDDEPPKKSVVMEFKTPSKDNRMLLNTLYDQFFIAVVLDILGYSVSEQLSNGEILWEKTVYNNDNN